MTSVPAQLDVDIKDLEKDKFMLDVDGNVAVRTGIVVEDIQIGSVEIKNATTDDRATVDTNGALSILDKIANSLVPQIYDYIGLTYTGSDVTTVVYKVGGSSGTTVSTLTLAYSSGNLVSITKTPSYA